LGHVRGHGFAIHRLSISALVQQQAKVRDGKVKEEQLGQQQQQQSK